jgi:hypothetical protein
MVSCTVRALADDGLVAIETDPTDARLRLSRVRAPARLLDAFEQALAPRRPRRVTWDVGARDVVAPMQALRDAAMRLRVPLRRSGVAGASLIRRVVEPAEAVVCMGRDDAECWADERMATPSRPAIGRITAQLAPDPFVLSLATDREGIRSPTRCSSTSTVGRPANARLRRPTRFEPRCAGEGRDPDPLLPEVGEVLVGIRTRSRNRSGCTAVGAGWSRGCPHADARCRRRRRNRWARAGRRAPGGERRAAERTAARAVLDLGQRLTQGSAPASVSPSPKGAARALALPSMIPSLPPPRPGPSKSGASGRRARRPG